MHWLWGCKSQAKEFFFQCSVAKWPSAAHFYMCILFSLFILFSGAAGTSGCGCQSSTPTFPKVPRLLSQCGTFMGPAEPFQSVEPLWLCLANMGKCVLALLLLAVVSRWCVKARWWEKSLGLPCNFLMTFPYYYNTQIGPHVLCNFTNVLPCREF